jgi:uncharacterized protein (DUF2236 family)
MLIHIFLNDENAVRDYFNDLIDLKMLPLSARLPFARLHRFVVTGLLPERLRAEMVMTWTAREDRKLAGFLRTLGAVSARMPKQAELFPINFYLADLCVRRRFGLRPV